MKVRHLCYDVESADHMNRFSNESVFKLPYVNGITADHTVTVSVSRMFSEEVTEASARQSVGGWDEQQFSARSIECYTCLSRFREM